MRDFNYTAICDRLLSKDIVATLTKIHEYKGKQDFFLNAKEDILDQFVEIAKIQSTDSSNRIEGICTSENRLKMLVKDKTLPRNRDEQEIAGYRDVLATIHESHQFIHPKPNAILQLHRDLYKYSGKSWGGTYKTANNVIEETDASVNQFVRFKPMEAWETADAIEKIFNEFEQAASKEKNDLLLVIPVFILDFLCIHPFNDGNGRISRLLTLLLLYRAGYIVGKYISIEKYIEKSKETYYEALQKSSQNWHDGTNDYAPFVNYTLGIILAAYREFNSRVEFLSTSGLSKPDRVRAIIKEKFGKITKREILDQCPDISQVTVQRALNALLKNNEIIKLSGGRYTQYAWNRENES